MIRAYLYVMGSNPNPDRVTCSVPMLLNDSAIFFGPCMPELRKKLGSLFAHRETVAAEEVYVVGLNSASVPCSSDGKPRSILWAGRVVRVPTFCEAYETMRQKIDAAWVSACRGDDSEDMCPLHVKPILERGQFVGYRKRAGNALHQDMWHTDLVSRIANRVGWTITSLELRPSAADLAANVFDRDACVLFERVFFASNGGLPLDREVASVLSDALGRPDIEPSAPFGRHNGRCRSRRRWPLELSGGLARRLVQWIWRSAKASPSGLPMGGAGQPKRCG